MTSAENISVRRADWLVDREALCLIRRAVFIDEQGVPEELEWEAADSSAVHLLAEDENGEPIGCARIIDDGHIGRMAVLNHWRGRGVGRLLMAAAIEMVRESGCNHAWLDAQTQALPFYEQLGFVAKGEEFMDAGIPHRHMELILQP